MNVGQIVFCAVVGEADVVEYQIAILAAVRIILFGCEREIILCLQHLGNTVGGGGTARVHDKQTGDTQQSVGKKGEILHESNDGSCR